MPVYYAFAACVCIVLCFNVIVNTVLCFRVILAICTKRVVKLSELYDRIDALCAQKKVTITAMCSSAEVSRASLTDLKMGRKQNLAAETLMKIAQYFDVTMEYLLTGEEKALDETDERTISKKDLQLALFGGDGEVTDEMWDEALFAVEMIKARHKRKKE